MVSNLRNKFWFVVLSCICRFIFATTFIVSGALKSIDPWGTILAIESYLATYPGVQNYLKTVVEQAKETGYVTTLYGRRRYIPELNEKNGAVRKFGERVAMNSPIQGTAADIIKIAMINVDRRLKAEGIDARMILQVHDELIIEAHRDFAERAAEILREEMESAAKLSVPINVDLSIGSRWYET